MSSITKSSLSSLQNAAMLEIAKSIFSHRIAHTDSANIDNLIQPPYTSDLIPLPLPNILKTVLNSYLTKMAEEVDIWMHHHLFRVFLDKPKSYVIPCLQHLIWYPDGAVDYISTARKLLEQPHIAELEKFEIAKVYFFQSYIKETWPQLSDKTIKECIEPRHVFQMMLDMSSRTSGYQLIRIHKRMERFLNWYYADIRRIIEFKYLNTRNFVDTSQEKFVRVVLHGLGYGVPV